jgi:hypothetical protein
MPMRKGALLQSDGWSFSDMNVVGMLGSIKSRCEIINPPNTAMQGSRNRAGSVDQCPLPAP